MTTTSLPSLSRRQPDSNKGNFGKVLVIAGSRGMSGAAVLSGSGALRGGAGLVRIATAHELAPIVAAGNPCYMTIGLPQDGEGRLSLEALGPLCALAKANNVVALGPGLGQSSELTTLVANFSRECETPIVLDADALNALAQRPEALKQHAGPVIITPHPGEFARLCNLDVPAVQKQRAELAKSFAGEFGVVVVLKGHGTIVTDGQRVYRNTTGNPGMSGGGSGDVLTGLTAALVGQAKEQGLDLFQAAQLAVHVHGLAGDLARADMGEIGMIATDLLGHLPRALSSLQI
jgi:NAD(P)H-hydrate epimerase